MSVLARGELNEFFETGGVFDRDFSQSLAIQIDLGALEAGNKLGIRHSVQAAGRVDADGPQAAEMTLALFAVAGRENHRAHDGFVRRAEKLSAAAEKTFGAL